MRSSTGSGTHHGDSCCEPAAERRPVVVEERRQPASTASSRRWWWPPSTATSIALAERAGRPSTCAAGARRGRRGRPARRGRRAPRSCPACASASGVRRPARRCSGSAQPPPEPRGRRGRRARRSVSTSVVRKLSCDELAEAAPDLVLAPRDDRRVRDREAERVAEQRGDGEPVGERADHRRLGERLARSRPTPGRRPRWPGRRGRRRPRRARAARWRTTFIRRRSRWRTLVAPGRAIEARAPARTLPRAPRDGQPVSGRTGSSTSAASSSQSGKKPTTSVKATAAVIARPAENGQAGPASRLAVRRASARSTR